MNAKEILIEQLETFGYPVFQQGSLAEDEAYPDAFFTFFNNDSYDALFYDNAEHETVYDFDVNIYATDPELVNGALLNAKKLLKSNGFIVDGAGYDVASDEPTHTGRGIAVTYIQKGV